MFKLTYIKNAITDKIRKVLMVALNIAKFLLLIGGTMGFVFCTLGADTTGKVGDMVMAGMLLSLLSIAIGVACEIFVVLVLLKPNERLRTIFDFDIYSNKKINPLIQSVRDIDAEDNLSVEEKSYIDNYYEENYYDVV